MRIFVALVIVVCASTAHADDTRAEDVSCAFFTPDDVAIEWVGGGHGVALRWASANEVPAQRFIVVLDHPRGDRITTTAMSFDPNNPYGVTFLADQELDERTHYIIRVWLLDCPHHWAPISESVAKPEPQPRYRCGTMSRHRTDDGAEWRGRFAAAVLILGAMLLTLHAGRRTRTMVP
jgi:hypothetical protein